MQTSISLLQRLRNPGDRAAWDQAWHRFHQLYHPLIQGWVRRDASLRGAADDITQNVMLVLVHEMPTFERRRLGSFRAWLRQITVHRVQAHYARRKREKAAGGSFEESPLAGLADPRDPLVEQWDREHELHLFRRLQELIEPQFEESTLAAFRLQVFEGWPAARVAEHLGMTVAAVYLAKSRVLARLRQEIGDLLD